MNYIATITSKRQLTIPAVLFKSFGFMDGEKVLISTQDKHLQISRFDSILHKLAGSVKVPKRFQGLSEDEMIKKAKLEHLKK